MKISRKRIGENIAARVRQLDKKGTPGATLAAAGIITQSGDISRWGNGACPDLEKVSSIADYYGVTVSYLIGETDQMGNEKEKFSCILDYFMELSESASISFDIVNPDPYDCDPRNQMTITEDPGKYSTTDLKFIEDYLYQIGQIKKTSLPEETKEMCKREIKAAIVSAARPEESEDK